MDKASAEKKGLRLMSEANFREFYRGYLYIECRDILEDLIGDEITDDVTGICTFGYIDDDAGLSFQPYKLGCMSDDGTFKECDVPENISLLVLRYHSKYMHQEFHSDEGRVLVSTITPQDHYFTELTKLGINLMDYAEFSQKMCDSYDTASPERTKLRGEDYSYLDEFRYPGFPDDVVIILYRPDAQPERAIVRCMFAANNEIFGTLMTEPKGNFGIHKGQTIGFSEGKDGDTTLLFATGHTATAFNKDE